MPVPSAISDLSQTAGSNYPAGSESPTTADDYLRTYASYIAKLRDGQGATNAVTLASATTTDIGGQVSQFVDISGTTTITSFGTNYNGPRYIRFTGALTLTHNATSLILPTGANITTVAGDSCIAYPNAALNGWTVVAYAGKSGQHSTITASGQITSTVSTGTAPLVIASTTKVANLNVDQLDGGDWASPGAIGSTTPSTGAFTTLSATGDVGIGTSAPSYKLDVVGEVRANNLFRTTDGTNIGLFGSGVFAAGVVGIGSSNSVPLVFGTGATECARIDSSGNLLRGGTVGGLDNANSFVSNAAGYVVQNHLTGTATGTRYAYFGYNGTEIGSITQNGTTAVAYNTTSDHRLKENVRPADAARFMDIEFVDFEWVDGRHDCGVIAHQLASVYPDLVLGEKDATEVRTVEITPAVKDEEGNEVTPAVTEEQTFPVYQQVNYIGLIGRMGTRVQQLQRTVDAQAALIAAMEARLAALEAQ